MFFYIILLYSQPSAGILSAGFMEIIENQHMQDEREEFQHYHTHQDQVEGRLLVLEGKMQQIIELLTDKR